MTGIQFITDAKGRKTAAIIDLKKHRALWEDIQDVLVSRSRRHEKRIPLAKVKADLIRKLAKDRFCAVMCYGQKRWFARCLTDDEILALPPPKPYRFIK